MDDEQLTAQQTGSDIPESLPPVEPSKTPPRKDLIFAVFLITLLVISIISGGIYFWRTRLSKASLLIEKSATWTSYQNEEYGFRMEYPTSWKINVKEKGGVNEGLALRLDWEIDKDIKFGLEADPRPLELVLSHLAPEKEKIIGNNKFYYTQLKLPDEKNEYSRWLYLTGGPEKTTPVFEIVVPQEKEKPFLKELESVLTRLEFIERKLPPTLTPTPTLSFFLPPEATKSGWKKPLSSTYNTPDNLTFTFHEIEVMDVNLPFTKEEKELLEKESSQTGTLLDLLGDDISTAKVAFDIRIVNNSQKKLFINPYDFKFKDELNHDLKGYFVLGAKEPSLYGELLPSETIRGYLTFDIPFNAKKLTLYRKRIIELSPTSGSNLPSTKEEYDTFPLEITPIQPTKTASNTTALSEFDQQYLLKILGFMNTLHLTSCVLIGEKCLGEEALKEGKTISLGPELEKYDPLYKNGLLGVATTAMAATYTFPPASLSFGLHQARLNLFSVKETHAQSTGLGMNALAAFSKLWSISRNISYSLIIIVLVIAGFLLIFGYKTNPNISIDLQKIIGRTVFVILAITFSYAIAGFLIDLMYLLLLMIFNIAKQNNLASAEMVESLYGNLTPGQIFQHFLVQNDPWAFAGNFIALIPENFQEVANWTLGSIIGIHNFPIVASGVHSLLTILEFSGSIGIAGGELDLGSVGASAIGFPLSMIIGKVVAAWLIKFILFIAVLFALLFLYFKILFILIGSYIEIVFEVIFAPFILLMDFLPGRNYFPNWFKRLVANMITFPLLAILFLAGASLNQAISQSSSSFLPPPLSGISQTIMASVVGIGILISIPTMIDRVKKWIIPEYTLVNFPTTPGALMGTVASIVPFIPTIVSLTNTLYGIKPPWKKEETEEKEKGKEKEEKHKLELPHVPHMPHGSPFEKI